LNPTERRFGVEREQEPQNPPTKRAYDESELDDLLLNDNRLPHHQDDVSRDGENPIQEQAVPAAHLLTRAEPPIEELAGRFVGAFSETFDPFWGENEEDFFTNPLFNEY
jgi:hypothetical protein